MISENSTKKTQARAFSYFAFFGNLGIFAGPFIGRFQSLRNESVADGNPGGILESPADKFPSTFGRVQFFKDYPYAFPGFVSAAIGASAAVLSAVFIKEVCLFLRPCNYSLTPHRRYTPIRKSRVQANLRFLHGTY